MTRTFGYEFELVVSCTGIVGADNYYMNYCAYIVDTTAVTCVAEPNGPYTTHGQGVDVASVWFIKP